MKKFLNKIFGKDSEQNEVNSKSLDEILNLEDETNIVFEIGQLLWNKSKDDKNFESLNAFERNVLYVEMLEGQVNNGGFDQYFFNSSGKYALETLIALKEIKAPQMAEILNRAIKVFPVLPIPKETEQRRKHMEDIPENVLEFWDILDEEFYKYPENLAGLVIEYVKSNKTDFV
jgi:hypothetical protein